MGVWPRMSRTEALVLGAGLLGTVLGAAVCAAYLLSVWAPRPR